MPAARYWRVTGIQTSGNGLHLAEFELIDGTGRVDSAAAISSNAAPVSGSLTALSDANTGTSAQFSQAQVLVPAFQIVWDFDASPKDIVYARPIGAASNAVPYSLTLEYSDDGVLWVAFKHIWYRYNAGATTPQDLPGSNYAEALLIAPSWGDINDYSFYKRASTRGGLSEENGYSDRYYFMPGVVLGDTFTIEGTWYREPAYVHSSPIMNIGTSGWVIRANSGNMQITNPQGTVMGSASSGVGLFTQIDCHTAWCRDAGVNRFFVRGALVSSWNDSTPIDCSQIRIYVPTSATGTAVIHTRVSRLARYTAAFGNLGPGSVSVHYRQASGLVNATTQVGRVSEYEPPAVSWDDRAKTSRVSPWEGFATFVGSVAKLVPPNSTAPLRRRVRLFQTGNMIAVKETWSDPVTGYFAFTNVRDDTEYTAIAYDHEGIYRPVGVDRVYGEV